MILRGQNLVLYLDMFDCCARGAIIGFMWWGEYISGAGAGAGAGTAAVSSVGSKKN